MIFPDHFNYKIHDINKIKKLALENNCKIITTEKDFMKIKKFKKIDVKFADVDLHIQKYSKFKKFLVNRL